MRSLLVAILLTASAGALADPAPTPAGVCPLLAEGWWKHELFPACSPPQFDPEGVACAGACPTPCAAHTTAGHATGPDDVTLEYNSAGRWLRSLDAHRDPLGTCTYTGGLLASCTTEQRYEVQRDAQGRLVEVDAVPATSHGPVLAVTYGPGGEVASMRTGDGMTATLTYDAHHRLSAEHLVGVGRSVVVTYKYDAAGRVIARQSPKLDWGRAGYTYDAAGRLATRTAGASSGGDLVSTFTYDDRGRPTKISTVAVPGCASGDCRAARDAREVTYAYACAP